MRGYGVLNHLLKNYQFFPRLSRIICRTPAVRNATTKIRHSSELGTLYPEKGSAKRYFDIVMDEVRIKDLASASGQLAEFDAFEFIVDVPTAAASMKVSGKEIKGVMAPKKHAHAVSDITGLSGRRR